MAHKPKGQHLDAVARHQVVAVQLQGVAVQWQGVAVRDQRLNNGPLPMTGQRAIVLVNRRQVHREARANPMLAVHVPIVQRISSEEKRTLALIVGRIDLHIQLFDLRIALDSQCLPDHTAVCLMPLGQKHGIRSIAERYLVEPSMISRDITLVQWAGTLPVYSENNGRVDRVVLAQGDLPHSIEDPSRLARVVEEVV